MKQNFLIAFLVVTLAVNVVLGIELYTALHPPVTGVSQSTTTASIPHSSTTASSISLPNNISKLYSFSYVFNIKVHAHHKGEYLVSISPTDFKELYVIIHFEDGETVKLSLNNTQAVVKIDERMGNVNLKIYVYGEAYSNLTAEQVWENLNFNIVPLNSSSED